ASQGNDTIYGAGGADTFNVSGHTAPDTFGYKSVLDSVNSTCRYEHIYGFSDTPGKQGTLNHALAFSAITQVTTVQGALNNTNQKVNAHSIAWVYDSKSNETLVYANGGSSALGQTSNGLMLIALDGNNFHLTANNFKA